MHLLERDHGKSSYVRRVRWWVPVAALAPNPVFVVFGLLFLSTNVFHAGESEYRRALNQQTISAYDDAIQSWQRRLEQLDRYLRLLTQFDGRPIREEESGHRVRLVL